MSDTVYEYRTQGKTVVSLLFLIVAIAVVVFGANSGVSIYEYMPIGFMTLFGAWWFMNNPKNGFKLTNETLEIWMQKETTSILLAEIDYVSINEWTDGIDNIHIEIRDGTTVPVSFLNYTNCQEFKQALETFGVRVEINT